MTRNPLISIIVPVYNGADFISECLDSILGQTYRDIEVIIVDDGSTDDSPYIISTYAAQDPRIISIRKDNEGPSAARNRGLDNIHGDFVAFVDADDTIHPIFIESMLAIAHDSDADISVCRITHNFNKLGLDNHPYYLMDPRGYVADVLYQTLSNNSMSGKLFKVKLWDNVRFINMRYEDLEIFPRICLRATLIAATNAYFYYYRINPNGFINSISISRTQSLDATDMICDYIKLFDSDSCSKLYKASKSRKLSASFNVFLITAGNQKFSVQNNRAWNNICTLRRECLLDNNVSLKIKLGTLVSYTGRFTLSLINKLFRISS